MKRFFMLAVVVAVCSAVAVLAADDPSKTPVKKSRPGIPAPPANSVQATSQVVIARGRVRSEGGVEVRCALRSSLLEGLVVITALPERSTVKAGDVIVTLDSSPLEERRKEQEIACAFAEAETIRVESHWKAAKIAMKEYLEGLYPIEEETRKGDAVAAKAAAAHAEILVRTLESARKDRKEDEQGKARFDPQIEAARARLDNARMNLFLAEKRLSVLRELTKDKVVAQLEGEVRSQQASLSAMKYKQALSEQRRAQMQAQIAQCTITASAAGRVEYVTPVVPGRPLANGFRVARIHDPSRMLFEGSLVNPPQVKVGSPVSIRIDLLREVSLKGVVQSVIDIAAKDVNRPGPRRSNEIVIRIDNPPDTLRAGFEGEVSIATNPE